MGSGDAISPKELSKKPIISHQILSLTLYFMNLILTYKKTSLFILGLLSATMFAPVNFLPIGFVTFSILLILVDKESPRKAFYLGWIFAFGHFSAGLYWISISLFVDISRFWWLLPFSISLIPAALAIYTALCCFFLL